MTVKQLKNLLNNLPENKDIAILLEMPDRTVIVGEPTHIIEWNEGANIHAKKVVL